jgi:hypothetical protein
MRLWSLHPKHLDRQGLIALWREGLLARKVLLGETKGYRHHPQLERFRATKDPIEAIEAYLHVVADDATRRGYRFDRSKLGPRNAAHPIAVTQGQMDYEAGHLLNKLQTRSPEQAVQFQAASPPAVHPSFLAEEGPIEPWERP